MCESWENFGRRLSSGEVSKANQKLLEPVDRWRNRSLAGEKFLYLFLDGTNFSMRRGQEVVKQCVLVVIGVNEARQLNQRPRKTLGFRSPAEVFNQSVASTG